MDRVEGDEIGVRAEVRPRYSLSFHFNERYTPQDITKALARLGEREVALSHPAQEIYRLLTSFERADWSNIENDPVLKGSLNLSPALLVSLFRLRDTRDWASLVLAQYPRLSGSLAREVSGRQAEVEEMINEALQMGGRYQKRICELWERQRRFFMFLAADTFVEARGLNLREQFLSPLKLVEQQQGYDPHFPNLRSRANGTRFPFGLRAFHGTLRLARQAVAQDSIFTALAQEYQFAFMAHAHYMQAIRTEAERELGAKIAVSSHGFVQEGGEELTGARLAEFLRTNQLIAAMRAIAEKDYGGGVLDMKEVKEIVGLGDFAYLLSIMMVDPAVNEGVTLFPIVEEANLKSLEIPYQDFYHYNQTHSFLRVVAQM